MHEEGTSLASSVPNDRTTDLALSSAGSTPLPLTVSAEDDLIRPRKRYKEADRPALCHTPAATSISARQCGASREATSHQSTKASQLLGSYACPICLEPPRNAVATPCGHLMCGECLFSSVKIDAVRNQGKKCAEARLAVLCDMARGIPETPPPAKFFASSTQSRSLYFLSAGKIAALLEDVTLSVTQRGLASLIADARTGCGSQAYRPWTKFLCDILSCIYTVKISAAATSNTSLQEAAVCAAIAPPMELAALLCHMRKPNGPEEGLLITAWSKLISTNRNAALLYHSETDSERMSWLNIIWSLFRATGTEWTKMYEELLATQTLIRALREVAERVPLPGHSGTGSSPRIERCPRALGSVLAFARSRNIWTTLQSLIAAGPVPTSVITVHNVLNQFSACLWNMVDPSRSFDQYLLLAKLQRLDAYRRRDPDHPSGLRLVSEELDPMVGNCPVCRASIPGGFFGKIRKQGVQGIMFKMGSPSIGPGRS